MKKEIKTMINLKEASNLLGKSPQQLRRMINSNKLPASKIGQKWMISQSKLFSLLDLDNKRLNNKKIFKKETKIQKTQKMSPKAQEVGYLNKEELLNVNPANPVDLKVELLDKTALLFSVKLTLFIGLLAFFLFSLVFLFNNFDNNSLKVFSQNSSTKTTITHIPTEQEKNISHAIFGD